MERVKSWFRRSKSAETTREAEQAKPASLPSEVGGLVAEYEQLEAERKRMREEIGTIDSQFASGKIKAAERDRAYRVRLSRAGHIGFRQVEIRNRLAELKYPIPQEWRVSSHRR
jgi:cell division protein FtsB